MNVGRPSNSSRLRLGITLIIVLMVISSPFVMLVNPALAKTTSADASSPLPTVSTIPSAPSTIGQNGKDGDFTTQAALSSLSARPTNNIVNTNSFYDVVFLTASAGAIKTIQVTFPAGTTIPSGAFFNEAEGIGPGTASKSGQTITYTVTNAVNVPAGTKIRLEFANINNPLNPSANYKVTVTTRNAANAIIDGPTQSTAYTMKQIGVNAIANNAITTPKIAEGAILPDTFFREGSEVTVPPEDIEFGDAQCLTGEVAVGGSFRVSTSGGFLTVVDSGLFNNGWSTEMYNSHPTASLTFTPEVTCMPAMP